MKNQLKTSKVLRWVATGALSLMLVLNVMVSLEFDKDKMLPSINFTELGNVAMAQATILPGEECQYRTTGQDEDGNYCCLFSCNYLDRCLVDCDCF